MGPGAGMDRLEDAKRLFLDAMALQEQGDLERAETLYKKALDLAPGRPSVMNNLAAVYIGLNRYADARLLCERLLELNPEDETALVNLGNCQLKLGSPADALLSCEKALRLKPGYAEALNCRGSALLELKRPQEALESCERALALKPDYVEALSNRGNILMALDRPEEALASYERALVLAPNHAEALYNLGTSLQELNRLPEALATYDRALAARPDYAEALNNRATTLLALKRVDEALASWNRALEVRPEYPEALYNRGDSLMQLNRPDEALASYERALILRPDYAAALNNRANTLMLLRRYQEASQDLERLLAVVPEYAYAAGQLVHCKMHMCEWNGLEQQIANLGVRIKSGKRASTPFPLLAASASAAEQLQCARTFALHKHPLSSRPVWNGERYRHERIRVGYVSGEFREHATSYLVAELFELHDRSRFEVFAVSTEAPDQSPMARRIARACEHFLDVSAQPDRAVASLLRNHEIDILLDLNGYFGRARTNVFAARAAPVQVNYLGFPGTMGAEYMDYIIADRHVIPEDQRHYFTEHVVYLPDSYQANDSKRAIAPANAGARRSRAAGARIRILLLQQQPQDPARDVRHLDATARADRGQRALAAAGKPGGIGQSAARGATAGRRAGAHRVRAAREAGGPSRAAPAGGPVPGHAPPQCAHHGKRRALGRASGADLHGNDLRRARRRQPAERGGAAGTHHAYRGGL